MLHKIIEIVLSNHSLFLNLNYQLWYGKLLIKLLYLQSSLIILNKLNIS